MHQWLDVWDGLLDKHVERLADAMDSQEEWIGNVVLQRRRRRLVSGGFGAVALALLVAAVAVFGADIRNLFLDEQQRARNELEALNIPFNVDGLSSVLISADGEKLELFTRAGATSGDVKAALRRNGVADQFFESSKGKLGALQWFKALTPILDPNMTIPSEYYEEEGILASAMRAGNVDASIILLEAGASPHVYQNLWFTRAQLPRSVQPFLYIDEFAGSAEEKARLAKAFVAFGASLSIPELDEATYPGIDDYGSYEVEEAIAVRDQIKNQYAIEVPTQVSICEKPTSSVCEGATVRTGFDWCDFAKKLPRSMKANRVEGYSGYYDFHLIELAQLVNVVNDKAYVLGYSLMGYRPGYVWIEISKDMTNWFVYKYVNRSSGMGHCKAEDGYVPDECWRRVDFKHAIDSNSMKMLDYYDYTKQSC